ncbi:MAG: O-methyltransferase [Bacteroidota bacterium]
MHTQKIEEYILNHIDPEDPLLAELNRETHVKLLRARMVSGPLQGKILEMVSKLLMPKKILEIGTFTGYSALCLAKGLAPDGQLDTIEINDELESFAKKYFLRSPHAQQIKQHIGDAAAILPTLEGSYDLAFIDGDKRQYLKDYELVLQRMRTGGVILADNVLWNGKVLEHSLPDDDYTKGIMDFNKFIKEDKRVEKVILPLRDGLSIIRKK